MSDKSAADDPNEVDYVAMHVVLNKRGRAMLRRYAALLRATLAQPQVVEVELKRVAEHLRQNQVDLPPEFAKVLRENYWDLLIGESPAQSAPAQEPVEYDHSDRWRNAAMALGERLSDVGPDGYYNFTPQQWLNWCIELAAPPQDEARDILFRAREQIRLGMALINISRAERDNWIDHAQMMDEEISAYLEMHK